MLDDSILVQAFAMGNEDPKFGEFINKVITGNVSSMQVLDTNKNPLVIDGIYTYNGERVQVISERYGQGNMMDTYYHVTFRKENFQTSSVCVDGQYPNGWKAGAVYVSPFIPIAE
jgi:hypothetical protein